MAAACPSLPLAQQTFLSHMHGFDVQTWVNLSELCCVLFWKYLHLETQAGKPGHACRTGNVMLQSLRKVSWSWRRIARQTNVDWPKAERGVLERKWNVSWRETYVCLIEVVAGVMDENPPGPVHIVDQRRLATKARAKAEAKNKGVNPRMTVVLRSPQMSSS